MSSTLPEKEWKHDISWSRCADLFEQISPWNPNTNLNQVLANVARPIYQEAGKQAQILQADSISGVCGTTLNDSINGLNELCGETNAWDLYNELDFYFKSPNGGRIHSGSKNPDELAARINEVLQGRGMEDKTARLLCLWFSLAGIYQELKSKNIDDPTLLAQVLRLRTHPLVGAVERDFRLKVRELKLDPNIPSVNDFLDERWESCQVSGFPAEATEDDLVSFLQSVRNDALRIAAELDPNRRKELSFLSGFPSEYVSERLILAIRNGDFSQVSSQDVGDVYLYLTNLVDRQSIMPDSAGTIADRKYYEDRAKNILQPIIRRFMTEYAFTNPTFMKSNLYEGLCASVELDAVTPEIPGLDVNGLANRALEIHNNRMETATGGEGDMTYSVDSNGPATVERVADKYPGGIGTRREIRYGRDSRDIRATAVVVESVPRQFEMPLSVRFAREKSVSGGYCDWKIEAKVGSQRTTWESLMDNPQNPDVQALLQRFGLQEPDASLEV